jgi:integrase
MRGLGVGRGGAREPEPVEAVPWPMVEPILPHLPAPLRATVLLQWESGARPTEILQLRTGDIDRSGDVWFYTPEKHKGQWRGQDRVIGFNTAAQDILRPLLKADPKAFLISPRDAIVELKARKRANRQTPLTPSQRARDERNARKAPQVGEFYDVNTYRRAIHRACDEADVPRWSPHRLRHAAGTRACLQGGEEATSVMLGHRDRRMAARYSVAAKRTRLADVLRRLG